MKHRKYIGYALGLLFIFGIGTFLFFQRSLAPLKGNLKLKGLSSSVEIIRDREGIPHIRGRSRLDVYRGLGFVLASERLFQMDLFRRLGSGRLSEVFGKKTLEADKLFRTLRFRESMEERMAAGLISSEVISSLEAFFDGVNQYKNNNPLPYEFSLLGYVPDDFSPMDAFSLIGYMAYNFGQSLREDIFLSRLKGQLPPQMLELLRVEPSQSQKRLYARNKVFSIHQGLGSSSWEQELFGIPLFEGSNAWTVSGKRSKSGKPLLASDPHTSFSLPGIWFEAHVQAIDENWDFYGHFLPLIPFPIMGHSKDLGWGLTISYVDDMDFYKETFHPTSQKVKYNGEWVPLIRYYEEIWVKGEEKPRALPIILTPHGPLLDEVSDYKGLSVKWAYHHSENRAMQGLYEMGLAKGKDDFKEGVSKGMSPGLNVIYADRQDNIAHWIFGAIPKRKKHTRSDFILNGGSGEDEYLGYFSFEEKPHLENPDAGVIISANSRPPYSDRSVRGSWRTSERYDTINFFLAQKEKWDLEDFKAIQTSSFNIKNKEILDLYLGSLEHLSYEKGTLESQAYDILKNWDLTSSVNSIGSSLFYEWSLVNFRNLLDEFNEKQLKGYCGINAWQHFYLRLLKLPNAQWWDIKKTDLNEKRDDVLRIGFTQMLKSLKKKMGNKMESWTWGKLHTLEFPHPLGKQRPLNFLFNLGPYPVMGNIAQINNIRSKGCHDHLVKSGPSTRRLVDFANADYSWGILPLGISGHLLSPFYQNQRERFLQGNYRPQLMDTLKVETTSEHILKLIPDRD